MPKHQETLSKRQVIKAERKKKQQRQRYMTILIVVGVALVVVALMIYPSLTTEKFIPQSRPNANFNAMGDPNAPVKIEEFSDFQCPYCQMFAVETEPSIVEEYVATGKVYFVFTPYGPSGNYIGPESRDAAYAAFCAADQGKFWEYKDMLYHNLTGENVGDFVVGNLRQFAEDIDLDMTQFNDCITNNASAEKVNAGIARGQELGVGGTPSFIINGQLVEGALPYDSFKQIIDNALAAAGQ